LDRIRRLLGVQIALGTLLAGRLLVINVLVNWFSLGPLTAFCIALAAITPVSHLLGSRLTWRGITTSPGAPSRRHHHATNWWRSAGRMGQRPVNDFRDHQATRPTQFPLAMEPSVDEQPAITSPTKDSMWSTWRPTSTTWAKLGTAPPDR